MSQPREEVRCANIRCNSILFIIQGNKIIQNKGGIIMIFEPIGSVTVKCKCQRVNVVAPKPAKVTLPVGAE